MWAIEVIDIMLCNMGNEKMPTKIVQNNAININAGNKFICFTKTLNPIYRSYNLVYDKERKRSKRVELWFHVKC